VRSRRRRPVGTDVEVVTGIIVTFAQRSPLRCFSSAKKGVSVFERQCLCSFE
jgi:hypothetical protein